MILFHTAHRDKLGVEKGERVRKTVRSNEKEHATFYGWLCWYIVRVSIPLSFVFQSHHICSVPYLCRMKISGRLVTLVRDSNRSLAICFTVFFLPLYLLFVVFVVFGWLYKSVSIIKYNLLLHILVPHFGFNWFPSLV